MQYAPVLGSGSAHHEFSRLVELIRILRDKDGCPWDLEQTHHSLKKCLIEESHELLQAVDEGVPQYICEELGDLLEIIVLNAQIASDAGDFDIDEVCRSISEKIIRRHPHIFYESKQALEDFFAEHEAEIETDVKNPQEVLSLWNQVKLMEHYMKTQAEAQATESQQTADAFQEQPFSIMDSIPANLPAVLQAQNIAYKCEALGFDWDNSDEVLAHVESEISEFKESEPGSTERMVEFGDIFFTLLNVARKEGIDPLEALQASNQKIVSRFKRMEVELAKQGLTVISQSKDELNELWEQVKKFEPDHG